MGYLSLKVFLLYLDSLICSRQILSRFIFPHLIVVPILAQRDINNKLLYIDFTVSLICNRRNGSFHLFNEYLLSVFCVPQQ